MNPFQPNRRSFVKTLSAGIAAGAASGGFFVGHGHGEENKKLGFALVGLGSLSTNQIAPALQKTQHCRLAGIVTGTPEKEKIWADKYGIGSEHIYNYENFDKIASDPEVDVVYVVLPNSMHEEYTIRAAKAGKHVLCEKPMANSVEECERMIQACKDANRKLAIGYRCQFEPHHLKAMEIIHSKQFGELKLIQAGFAFRIGDPTQWRLRKDLAGGGALMDIGIYALQSCRYLTQAEPLTIMAQETKTDPVKFAEVDESITWSMTFPDNVLAHCSTSYNFNGLNSFKAFNDRGFVELDPAYNYDGIRGRTSRGPINAEAVDQFAAEMDDFAQCIKEDRESRVAGEEGLRDLRVIEAIYESIATGKAVELSA